MTDFVGDGGTYVVEILSAGAFSNSGARAGFGGGGGGYAEKQFASVAGRHYTATMLSSGVGGLCNLTDSVTSTVVCAIGNATTETGADSSTGTGDTLYDGGNAAGPPSPFVGCGGAACTGRDGVLHSTAIQAGATGPLGTGGQGNSGFGIPDSTPGTGTGSGGGGTWDNITNPSRAGVDGSMAIWALSNWDVPGGHPKSGAVPAFSIGAYEPAPPSNVKATKRAFMI